MNGSCWKILISKETDPFYNLTMEKSLFLSVEQCVSPNTIFFWKNKRSVFIGVSQKPEEVLNLELCKKIDVPVLRRFTGGGEVYHDLGNLNWTFICKRKGSIIKHNKNLQKTYEIFLKPVIYALRELGVDAKVKSINNIFLHGNKISGSAMRIKQNAVICHGNMILESDLNILKRVIKNLKYPVTNINDVVDNKIDFDSLINEIITSTQKIYSIEICESKIYSVQS